MEAVLSGFPALGKATWGLHVSSPPCPTPSSGPLPSSGMATHRAASGLGAESEGWGVGGGVRVADGLMWAGVRGGQVGGGSDPGPSRGGFEEVTWRVGGVLP